jgi:hypothetical protein
MRILEVRFQKKLYLKKEERYRKVNYDPAEASGGGTALKGGLDPSG